MLLLSTRIDAIYRYNNLDNKISKGGWIQVFSGSKACLSIGTAVIICSFSAKHPSLFYVSTNTMGSCLLFPEHGHNVKIFSYTNEYYHCKAEIGVNVSDNEYSIYYKVLEKGASELMEANKVTSVCWI